jgi:hypothetical protein
MGQPPGCPAAEHEDDQQRNGYPGNDQGSATRDAETSHQHSVIRHQGLVRRVLAGVA